MMKRQQAQQTSLKKVDKKTHQTIPCAPDPIGFRF